MSSLDDALCVISPSVSQLLQLGCLPLSGRWRAGAGAPSLEPLQVSGHPGDILIIHIFLPVGVAASGMATGNMGVFILPLGDTVCFLTHVCFFLCAHMPVTSWGKDPVLLECSGSFPAVPDAAIDFLLHLSLGHLIELLRLLTASDPSTGSAIHPGPPLSATPEPQGKSGLRCLWSTASESCPLGVAVALDSHEEGYPGREMASPSMPCAPAVRVQSCSSGESWSAIPQLVNCVPLQCSYLRQDTCKRGFRRADGKNQGVEVGGPGLEQGQSKPDKK